jgi:hypothetical protein
MNAKLWGLWRLRCRNAMMSCRVWLTNVTGGVKGRVVGITSSFRMGCVYRMMVTGVTTMDLVEHHDALRRSEGARGFWASLTALGALIAVGFALANTPVTVASPGADRVSRVTTERVARLQNKVDSQAEDISRLRTLLDVCVTGGCTPAQVEPQLVGTRQPARPSDDGGDTEVRVETTTVQPKPSPTSSPQTKEPAPSPSPKPSTTKSVDPMIKQTTDTVKEATKDTLGGVLGGVKKATDR